MNNKKVFHIAAIVLLVMMLCGCGRADAPVKKKTLSDEEALSAVRNYCYTMNPELEDIEAAGEYPVYWDVSGDEHETVVLFRSYTGAQLRYHTDRITGETYVTEFVPGITAEEQRTDDSFNIWDYLPDA